MIITGLHINYQSTFYTKETRNNTTINYLTLFMQKYVTGSNFPFSFSTPRRITFEYAMVKVIG